MVYATGRNAEAKRVEAPISVNKKGGSQAIRSTTKSSEKNSGKPKRKLSKRE